ncbi:WXG100 family type VII secretion target [Promicromonospora thailandica]|uniref:Conserved protein YukE n=1 Tax=Promicromonospora thailandica TaxID=765201 RepID=A0A9X2G4S5_9MICO|nr:hypothetical protein [Promicromonospora thailandica]MCP2263274.1 putative conserved protein YukE [Promicromonospora thailandica]BFF18667.1 hypothetical protein GCM10025730_21880 [Promicromonospora thailandica]
MSDIDGTTIRVGGDLAAAGSWLNQRADICSEELARLRGQLAPLQESWTESQAAEYYQALQQQWNVAADGLFGPEGVLGQIAQAMNVNWGNYSEAEWANTRSWQH